MTMTSFAGEDLAECSFVTTLSLGGGVGRGEWLRFCRSLATCEDTMLARQVHTMKRMLAGHVGIAYLRVPAIRVDYVRPFATLLPLDYPSSAFHPSRSRCTDHFTSWPKVPVIR